jgi:hypothetical protein
MAQLSRVHWSAECVVPERVPRGPFIKPSAMRVVVDCQCGFYGLSIFLSILKITIRIFRIEVFVLQPGADPDVFEYNFF